MNLPSIRTDRLAVTQRRLELKWCSWPGDWPSFVKKVKLDGDEYELMVLDRWPQEFQTRANQRAARVATWQENTLIELLGKMHSLTEATKTNKEGDQVPDNGIRFNATKFLLERTLGEVPKSGKPDTKTGDALNRMVERREELRRILADSNTRDVEFSPSDDEPDGAVVELPDRQRPDPDRRDGSDGQ